MKILLFDSIEEAKALYPKFTPSKNGKKREDGERIYTKIGKAQDELGIAWQLLSLIKASTYTVVSSFVSQADRPSVLKHASKLFTESHSGNEKVTLFVRDKDTEAKVQRAVEAALKKVRESADRYKDLPLAMRGNEKVTLAAIESSHTPIMQHSTTRMQNTKRVALTAVKKNAENYRHLHVDMRNDIEVTLTAVTTDFNIFEYAPTRMQQNSKVRTLRDSLILEDRCQRLFSCCFGSNQYQGHSQDPFFFMSGFNFTFVPNQPAVKKWQCPKELKNDNTAAGQLTKKVLTEAAASGLNFEGDNASMDKRAFRPVLCKMMSLPTASQDAEIKAKFKKAILLIHPDKKPNDPHAAEAMRKLQMAFKIAELKTSEG